MPSLEERIKQLEMRLLVVEKDILVMKDKDIFLYRWNSASGTMEFVGEQDE